MLSMLVKLGCLKPKIQKLFKEQGQLVATLDADFHTLLALDKAKTPSGIRIRVERLRAQTKTDLFLFRTCRLPLVPNV